MSAHERRPAPKAGSPPIDDVDEKVLVMGPSVMRAHIPELCDRARRLLEDNPRATLVCDVGALLEADAVGVDALARLQLTARRVGAAFRLRDPSSRLMELLVLTGLSEVIRAAD